MSIYKIDYDYDQYKALYIPGHTLIRLLKPIQGKKGPQSLASHWIDVTGELEQKNMDASASDIPDITFWSKYLAFSAPAYAKLVDRLEPVGEFLPVNTSAGIWYIFNILQYADHLVDETNSQQDISNNVCMGLKALTFTSPTNEQVFKINFDQGNGVYCTEAFKNLIKDLQLTGLVFTKNYIES